MASISFLLTIPTICPRSAAEPVGFFCLTKGAGLLNEKRGGFIGKRMGQYQKN